MYKISIFNKGVETVIHYPDADKTTPKISVPHLNKKRGQAGSLTFTIYPNNPAYNLLTRMATLITVVDIRDDKEVFSGRVFTNKSNMDDKGFKKDIICEGELNFLHDTVVDSVIYEDKTPTQLLQIFLDAHNSTVENYKKIFLGNCDVEDWLFCTTGLETTLEAITKYIYNEQLGYLQLRKVNGIKYLDYLKATTDKVIDVVLSQNMLNLIQTDAADFGTRIVPIGANSMTIETVNGGLNYLEDSEAVAEYGIIYKTVEFKDIDDDAELKNQCLLQLDSYTKPKKSLEVTAVDLATLSDTSINMIDENTSVHMVNQVMQIDETWKCVEYDVDLSTVWSPKLTLSNKGITLTGTLSSIIGSMVTNDGDYNGVQIGDSFGLRIKKGLVKLLLNATEGISISNGTKKVFYVDTNGDIVEHDVTANDMTANNGIFNNIKAIDMTATRGVFNDIIANNGTYNNINTRFMISTLMRTSNTNDYMIFHDQFIEFYHDGTLRMKVGFDGVNNYAGIKLYGGNGIDEVGSITAGNNSPTLQGNWSVEEGSGLYMYGNTNLSTKEYVDSQISSLWQQAMGVFATK
ncbi:phage tail protein [Clostridium estertheticum]|uniref:Phage tail protein n=1 Tax=Clostridium estertheticum TaxID=238834 RepID=A0AA47I7Z3_9CLOT|nr:phage tail protein [Clostridium estertheticum]MBU3153508.1 phage tail protein [Clostridium estertheticum]WAG60909.1 phage tail protein [Clostridium estertheticum]